MNKLAYASLVAVGLISFACNKETSAAPSGSTMTNTPAAAMPAADKAMAAAPAAGGAADVGVQECDDYLKKMESCLGKMPAEARSAQESAVKQSREAWRTAAGTEAGKAGLKQGCQSALDALAQNPMCK